MGFHQYKTFRLSGRLSCPPSLSNTLILTLTLSNCESINLSFNQITADGVKHLVDMIEVNKTLRYVWLASNQIGNKGTVMLCSVVKRHDTRHSLDLSSNEITDESVAVILDMMEATSTMKLLFIDANQISDGNKERLRAVAKEQEINLGDLF